MSWVQTTSPRFAARHDARDERDAIAVLELLEGTRERLAATFAVIPDEVTVILHGSPVALTLAAPLLPAAWLLTAPAGRRYLCGMAAVRQIHVLAPRRLEERASAVPGSREMLMLSPAALYAQLVVGANNPRLPPPYRPPGVRRYVRWAWLYAGAAQYFSGQTPYARPAIARRLREGRAPRFPPRARDAGLLGGSLFDLLARERGEAAAGALACATTAGAPQSLLRSAFAGRPVLETEALWREHLLRLSAPQA